MIASEWQVRWCRAQHSRWSTFSLLRKSFADRSGHQMTQTVCRNLRPAASKERATVMLIPRAWPRRSQAGVGTKAGGICDQSEIRNARAQKWRPFRPVKTDWGVSAPLRKSALEWAPFWVRIGLSKRFGQNRSQFITRARKHTVQCSYCGLRQNLRLSRVIGLIGTSRHNLKLVDKFQTCKF